MVFHCRCFSLSFVEEVEIEYEATTQTKSTSYYTASSDLNGSLPDSQPNPSNLGEKTRNLRVCTFPELKAATKNFCRASKMGEGRFGSVYRGVIKSLQHPFHDIQVSVHFSSAVLEGGTEWLSALSLLGEVEHPNLVKLIGYCAEYDVSGVHHILVYEFMINRSVMRSETPLSWTMRLKVAQDVARGLTYLHEEMDIQIIIRDFKCSKILPDDQWNAKLLDFGLAQLSLQEGLVHVSTGVGHRNHGIIQKGHHTTKSDVWSYGVFLYELITGRRPLDWNRPMNERNLLDWVKPHLDSKNFQLLIDPRLKCNYSFESAEMLFFIANKCLSENPESRPMMSEVLVMVNRLIGVPSQATNLAPPPKSLVRVTANKLKKVFMCTTKVYKDSIDIQFRQHVCLPLNLPTEAQKFC